MTLAHPRTPKASAELPPELRAAVEAAWPRAMARWSPFVLLREPVNAEEGVDLAAIDLRTREMYLAGAAIVERGLVDCVEALLAHEIGHHLRWPGDLGTAARMHLLERTLLPFPDVSMVNLFDDLLINDHLGPEPRPQLVRLYQAFHGDPGWGRDAVFSFYMAIYEELWQLPAGTLLGPAREGFEARYPNGRADAQLVAQDLFALGPNIYTQFLYFAAKAVKYLELREPRVGDPMGCAYGEPTPSDWADALTPTQREKDAIRRAVDSGWITAEQARDMGDRDALDRRIAGLPGHGTADASLVPEVMAAWYRMQAERYLVAPPPVQVVGEAVVPTTLEDWEPGDSVAAIDWTSTLVLRGDRLGATSPLRRERMAEYEGWDAPVWQPYVEIYLDVSGSMPDPRTTVNAMTLAAQILATGAIRAGGWARALVYSGSHVALWSWCRSEVDVSRFLMHYIGGGTTFPFQVLASSVRECQTLRPVRVVITDRDFDSNYATTASQAVFAAAARTSAPLLLLLHSPRPQSVAHYRDAGAQVVAVEDLADFPAMAGAVARALFTRDGSVVP